MLRVCCQFQARSASASNEISSRLGQRQYTHRKETKMTATQPPAPKPYLETVDQIIKEVIAPAAADIDQQGTFPRAAIEALGRAGLLGLISANEVGGLGQGHRAATIVVERIASACASTAMVVCMHYCGTAVIEAYGPKAVREAVARGEHLTTLAFSEVGSRRIFGLRSARPNKLMAASELTPAKAGRRPPERPTP